MPASPARPVLHPAEDAETDNGALPEPRFDGRDLTAAVGLLLIVAGVAQFSPPSACIVFGLALLAVAWRT